MQVDYKCFFRADFLSPNLCNILYFKKITRWMSRKNKFFSHENDVTTFTGDQSTDTHWTWLKYSYCCTSRWPANAFILTSFLPYLIFNNHPFSRINGHGNIKDEVLFVPNMKIGKKEEWKILMESKTKYRLFEIISK